MLGKPRIIDLLHFRLFLQPVRDTDRIFLRFFHPYPQRLDASDQKPAVKRCKSRTGRLDQESKFLCDLRILRHDKTCQRVVMSAEEFRTAVDDHVRAEPDRILEIW